MKEGEILAKTCPPGSWVLLFCLWLLREGSGKRPRGPKADIMLCAVVKGHPTVVVSHPFSFICCDYVVDAAHYLELSGQRGLSHCSYGLFY